MKQPAVERKQPTRPKPTMAKFDAVLDVLVGGTPATQLEAKLGITDRAQIQEQHRHLFDEIEHLYPPVADAARALRYHRRRLSEYIGRLHVEAGMDVADIVVATRIPRSEVEHALYIYPDSARNKENHARP